MTEELRQSFMAYFQKKLGNKLDVDGDAQVKSSTGCRSKGLEAFVTGMCLDA